MADPVIAQKSPVAVRVEEGETYWWCVCGRSKNQPFCDGSHEGTEFKPLEYKAENSRMLSFCACKQTKRAPLCDGSHNDL